MTYILQKRQLITELYKNELYALDLFQFLILYSLGENDINKAISVLEQAKDFINGSGAEEGEEGEGAEDGGYY